MRKRVSFAPLDAAAAGYLSRATSVDFRRVDFDKPRWFCVTAYDAHGELAGVLACEFKNGFDVHFSCAIADQQCMSRRLLQVIFKTLFTKAVRITALVSPFNERAIRQMHRLGFVYEGFVRLGVEGTRDALLFGMLRSDCRFLPGYRPAAASVQPISLGGQYGLVS